MLRIFNRGKRWFGSSGDCVCAHPTPAYKLSATIMEEGSHCVKDKSGACNRWEITVIHEGLSLQRQVSRLFGGLSVLSPFLNPYEEAGRNVQHIHLYWQLDIMRSCMKTLRERSRQHKKKWVERSTRCLKGNSSYTESKYCLFNNQGECWYWN